MEFPRVRPIQVDDLETAERFAQTMDPLFIVVGELEDEELAPAVARLRAAAPAAGIIVVATVDLDAAVALARLNAYCAESWLAVTSQHLVAKAIAWARAAAKKIRRRRGGGPGEPSSTPPLFH